LCSPKASPALCAASWPGFHHVETENHNNKERNSP
jgi:hypothetical protein